jgi:hypothetical protein
MVKSSSKDVLSQEPLMLTLGNIFWETFLHKKIPHKKQHNKASVVQYKAHAHDK